MPFYPQLQTQLEIAVSTQLKAAPGHMLKFLVHTRATDKTKVWRVWDSASGPVSGDPGNIVGAWYADDPKVSPGSVVESIGRAKRASIWKFRPAAFAALNGFEFASLTGPRRQRGLFLCLICAAQ